MLNWRISTSVWQLLCWVPQEKTHFVQVLEEILWSQGRRTFTPAGGNDSLLFQNIYENFTFVGRVLCSWTGLSHVTCLWLLIFIVEVTEWGKVLVFCFRFSFVCFHKSTRTSSWVYSFSALPLLFSSCLQTDLKVRVSVTLKCVWPDKEMLRPAKQKVWEILGLIWH